MAKKEISAVAFQQAVVDGHKNNWSAQELADYLGIAKSDCVSKLNSLRKTIKEHVPNKQQMEQLLALTQLRDCRGRPRVDPATKIASLLSLLDASEEQEESDTPE